MVKIVSPEEKQAGGSSRIKEQVPTGGAQSIDAVGKQFGEELAKTSKHYFDLAYESIQDTYTDNASSKAQLEFTTRYMERVNQKVGKDGNPTYATLEKDIDDIAKDVQSKYGMGLIDSKSRGKFNSQFQNLYINKKVHANAEARNQHLEYANYTMEQSLGNLEEAASRDPSTIATSKASVETTITNGLKNGTLDYGSASNLRRRYESRFESIANKAEKERKEAEVEKYATLIRTDPKGAAKLIKSLEPTEDLPATKLLELENKADSEARQEEVIIERKVAKAMTDADESLKKGIPLSITNSATLDDFAKEFPEKKDVIDALQTQSIGVQLLNDSDGPGRVELLNELKLNPGLGYETKEFLDKTNKNIEQRIKEDPVGYTVSADGYVVQAVDVNGNLTEQLIARKPLAEKTKAKTGKDNVGLTTLESDSIVAAYNDADNIDTKLNLVGSIVQGLGKDSDILFAEIKAKDKDSRLPYVGSLVLSGNRSAAEMVLKGSKIRKDNPDLIKFIDKDFFDLIEKDSLIDSIIPSQVADIQNSARDIYYYKSSIEGDYSTEYYAGQSDKNRYQSAVKSLVGGDPIVWNGKKLQPPVKGMEAYEFDNFIEMISPNDIDDPEDVSKEDFLDKLKDKDYTLLSAGEGKYAVVEQVGNIQDLVYTKSGKGFIIDYNKILKGRSK